MRRPRAKARSERSAPSAWALPRCASKPPSSSSTGRRTAKQTPDTAATSRTQESEPARPSPPAAQPAMAGTGPSCGSSTSPALTTRPPGETTSGVTQATSGASHPSRKCSSHPPVVTRRSPRTKTITSPRAAASPAMNAAASGPSADTSVPPAAATSSRAAADGVPPATMSSYGRSPPAPRRLPRQRSTSSSAPVARTTTLTLPPPSPSRGETIRRCGMPGSGRATAGTPHRCRWAFTAAACRRSMPPFAVGLDATLPATLRHRYCTSGTWTILSVASPIRSMSSKSWTLS